MFEVLSGPMSYRSRNLKAQSSLNILMSQQLIHVKHQAFELDVLMHADCKAVSHPECKDLVPIPCIPSTNTPIGSKLSEGCLTDYAPLDPPYIPALVVN